MTRLSASALEELLSKNPRLSVRSVLGKGDIALLREPPLAKHKATSGQAWKTGSAGNAGRKKYGNMRVVILAGGEVVFESACIEAGQPFPMGELTFASEKEFRRYMELKTLEESGKISGLELQRDFVIQPGFTTATGERIRAITYRADFVYLAANGITVVEDVKARSRKTGRVISTQTFALKWKLLKCLYPDFLFRIEA